MMEEHINTFDKQFYTDLILLCSLVATIIVSGKNNKKFRILKYFPVYAVSFFIGLVINRLSTINHIPNMLSPFATYLDFFLTLLELLIFSQFYHQLIKNSTVKRLIIWTNVLFVLFFIYMGVSDKNFYAKGI